PEITDTTGFSRGFRVSSRVSLPGKDHTVILTNKHGMDNTDDAKNGVPEIGELDLSAICFREFDAMQMLNFLFAIDKPEQQLFVKFFRGLPQKPDGTIRLFERDASQKRYYTFHGDDALYIAQNVYKTTSAIKYWGGDMTKGLSTSILSHSAAEAFLRDALLTKQLRVEIWTPDGSKKAGNAWKLARKASPGNLQDVEDYLFANTHMSTAPIVLAVKLGTGGEQKIVGVAFADASIRELGVAQFVDNELYSNLESLAIQLGVKECIVLQDESHKDYELIKLKGVLDRAGIVITERKKGDFNAKDIEQDLNRLLESEISVTSRPEFEMRNAMAASACLIKYLSLMSDESNFGHYTLRTHDLSQFMRLDASALRALNLMPGPQDGSNKTMSLFGLLNKCKTAQGARLLGQWLKQPLMNVEEIEKRQDLVEIFTEDTELRQSLQEDHLKSVPDLHRLAKRFQRGVATLQDVVRMYQVVIRLPGLLACLESYNGEEGRLKDLLDAIYISKLKEYSENLENLQELVETTIDLEAVEDHEFLIKSDFDETLQELRARISEVRSEMDQEHDRVGRKLNLDTEKKLKMEKHNVYGHCFRVMRTDASAIRNKSEYHEYATQKAGTYFATGKMRDLSQTWNELSTQYDRKQSDLVKEVITIVDKAGRATYCPVLETLGGLIAHLDVLVSFAHVSVHAPIPYVRPKVIEKGQGDVILAAARHPCLEVQDDVSFIPNDVELMRGSHRRLCVGYSFGLNCHLALRKSEFQIITGPNMGGKSTYIRQIGVIALMAQTGCFVPCSEATLCVFDSILARVGAGDSQLKGVSTFMAEMLETATILKSATANSLIVIDELGRGTSTYDGFGLAWAISEYIATEIQCFCLFATHFHELTVLGDTVLHVRNLNVAVHVGEGRNGGAGRDITLLYKVNEGVCDQSFGIHVAELANFPETVVKLAKRKANELEDAETTCLTQKVLHTAEMPPTKCSRGDIDDGNTIIERCLAEFAATPDLEELGHEMLLERLKGVRNKYIGELEANPYVREVMAGL
ncbi:muts domain V-domain-containing protein, partial [Endogone sp. FLAS-F59071]